MNVNAGLFSSTSLLFFLLCFFQSHCEAKDVLKNYNEIELPGVLGPESIAFDCRGKGPYVGVSDGRIFKWQGPQLGWTEFAIPSADRDRKVCDRATDPELEQICGRPLGLKFNTATCELFIADATFGLLKVGLEGGVATQLANSAEGVPFQFTNGLDININTGEVFFTVSSMVFQRRDYALAFISMDKTGRLLKYDPHTNNVTVLHRKLAIPNGIALSKNNSFLLVAESTTSRILKFSFINDSTSVGTPKHLVQLKRPPDNIKRNAKGEFWVALVSGLDEVSVTVSMPSSVEDPVGVKINEEGRVIGVLSANGSKELESISEVEEVDGVLWIGSVVKPYVAHIVV
ncbi:protein STRICTOSIDINE SYNTHASE-LIKE 10-like [Tripterygium wilfordii]|uniref:protein STRICTOSIDINE SYNTHASE-LIKE 10-like n=1 Tax=Tripterygium wilfordii TaxID=458696 RepID=UPI0018F7EDE2|nr:protein STRICTOSIDINE SYNTHASE-LIKE 10-like [Tripterygium wilfordii]